MNELDNKPKSINEDSLLEPICNNIDKINITDNNDINFENKNEIIKTSKKKLVNDDCQELKNLEYKTLLLNVFSIISLIISEVSEVISDGFIKIEFPAEIAFTNEINDKLIGKFQGVIINTIPFASYFIYDFDPSNVTGVLTYLSFIHFLKLLTVKLISDIIGKISVKSTSLGFFLKS